MSTFKNTLSEHRRLATLRLMYASPNYTLNSYIIKSALNETGHLCNDNNITDDVCHLSSCSCVEIIEHDGETFSSMKILRLTSFGEDVARGTALCVGVKRPSPSDNLPALPF